MRSMMIDRRTLLASATGLGALSLLPAPLLARRARDNAIAWPAVQALLDSYAGEKMLSGVGAAIGRGTDDAVFLSAGTLGFDDKRRIDPDSLYRVYSMTKPITGVAMMMLWEQGK